MLPSTIFWLAEVMSSVAKVRNFPLTNTSILFGMTKPGTGGDHRLNSFKNVEHIN